MFRFFVLLGMLSIDVSIVQAATAYSQPYAPYYSQCGQDKFLRERIFHDDTKGFFVDIGAHDGVSFSNTFFFEKELGWEGICFEPNPDVFKRLSENRKCVCYNMAIADYDGESTFLQIIGTPEMLSGLIDKYDPRHLRRVDLEINRDSCEKQLIPMQVAKLNTILAKHQIRKINLLSIDVEGSEFDILKNIDYANLDIDVIVVENNYQENLVEKFLRQKGFVLVKKMGDDIFVNKKFKRRR